MSSAVTGSNIVTVFEENIVGIDSAFKVSELIQNHFVASFEHAIKNPGIARSQVQQISNAKNVLESIRKTSISDAEKEVLGSLYKFGVISIVAVAEQLLKSVFNSLLLSNLENIKKPEKITVDLTRLKDSKFITDKQFWLEEILNDLYGAKNAQEKLNFQNIKAVDSLFKEYFDINLSDAQNYDSISRSIHLYYQIRHILVHNAGYVDDRFLHNIKSAGIKTRYTSGELLLIGKKRYEDCKTSFTNLFFMIEALVEQKGIQVNLD